MKVLPFKIPKVTDHSFRVQHDNEHHFYDTLHQHPEIQITLIKQSTGTLILGDHIGEFRARDVIVVGANIPHVFRNDSIYYESPEQNGAQGISIFFDKDSLGATFFDLPEMADVKHMQNVSGRGLKVVGSNKEALRNLILYIDTKSGVRRMIDFLEILHLVSKKDETVFLSSEVLNSDFKESEGQRLSDIFQFTMKEYQRPIALHEVAWIAKMTVSSFCRYFKQRTRKTYINFLNEVRIGQACKLLVDEDHTIGEICYLSGFNNLSHFNKKFKVVTGFTPKQYIQHIRVK